VRAPGLQDVYPRRTPVLPPEDPVKRLDFLLRMDRARPLIVRTEARPRETWLDRNGVGILVAACCGGLMGYLLGVFLP